MTEHLLYEAGMRGDVEAQLRVLAGADLYIRALKADVAVVPDMIVRRSHRDEAGRYGRQGLTQGVPWTWPAEGSRPGSAIRTRPTRRS
ncbi:hypothetical protein ACIQZB_34380 [Streptomyces sp. NPDC097727]|uniref:hypothetical protein n=1 Tax=Streptomyces sp. NPDC097727 TaxID=3366092 RepID=UPI00382525F6